MFDITGHISAFFRIVPSPPQGTSHKIRSNFKFTFSMVLLGFVTLMFGKIDASWFVLKINACFIHKCFLKPLALLSE